jgi:aspartate/glutamate/glutamine transport system permease protein
MGREWTVFLDLQTWLFLGGGLLVTLQIAAAAVLFSLVTGTLMALARLSRVPLVRHPAALYIDVVRGIPVFLIIIFTFFGLGRLKVEASVAASVTIALTIYATALIAEIVRAGILAVPRGQIDAARGLGLSHVQTSRYVVFPQAFRMMIPALAGQYIMLIKSTAIGAVIGLDEVLRRAVILYNGYQNPLQSLFAAGCIYFVLLFTLSKLSRRLELPDRTISPPPDVDESSLYRLRAARLLSRGDAAGMSKAD